MPKPDKGVLTRREQERHRAWVAERIWFGVMTFVGIVVLLTASLTALAAWQPTCELCHSQQAKAMTSDPHKGVRCDQCHAGSTAFGLVQSRLSVVNMAIAQLNPFDSYTSARIENERCLLCHADKMNKTVIANGVKMSHTVPLEKGWQCQSCHPNVGHGSGGARRAGYTMDGCMACHNANPKNAQTCYKCHVNATGETAQTIGYTTPWRVTHGANWKTTHGMGDLASCQGCHETTTFCASCHHVTFPHADNFLRTHGPEVLARPNGRTDCLVCHRVYSCDNCHGLPMPHPDGFLKQHSSYVKKNGRAGCLRCHAETTCTDCHSRHTHPGLEPDYLKQLKARPVNVP